MAAEQYKDPTAPAMLPPPTQAREWISNAVLDSPTALIVVLDSEGRILSLNAGFETLTGYDLTDFVGRNWFETLCPRAQFPEVWREFTRLKDQGAPREFENPIITKDGQQRIIHWHNHVRTHNGHLEASVSLGFDVTTQRGIERELQGALTRLEEAQALGNLGSWEWDVRSNRVTWSPELYRIYGIDPRSFASSYEAFLDLVHPEDRAMVESNVRRSFAEASPFSFEHRIIRADGQLRVLRARGRVVTFPSGEPDRMVGTGQDITESYEREARHRAAEARFRSLLDSAPDAIIVADSKGSIQLASAQMERLFGYKIEELHGKTVESLMPERFRASHVGHRSDYSRDPRPRPMGQNLELFAQRKDGSEFPVEISLSPMNAERETLVIAAIRDVTARRDADRARAHLAAIVESTSDAIISKDLTGVIQSWNEGARRVYGYAPQEAVGRPASMLAVPGTEGEFEETTRRVLAGETVGHFEGRRRRKDGRVIDVALSISAIRGDNGKPIGVSVVSRDITAEKEIAAKAAEQERAAQELDRLRQIDALKTTFINTAAHELKTPLVPLRVQTHLLKNAFSAGLTAQQQQAVQALDRNLERLNRLVDDVLNAARIQSDRLKLNAVALDLRVVLRDCIDTFNAAMGEAGIRLESDFPQQLPVEADGQRIGQVVTNLLSNALKFTPRGGRVRMVARDEKGKIIVEISDTGRGLTAEQIGRLFLPFSQVHDRSRDTTSGTGLGLYICKGIIEQHRGTIWARSEGPDRGTTFAFQLPATRTPLPVEDSKRPVHPASSRDATDRLRQLI